MGMKISIEYSASKPFVRINIALNAFLHIIGGDLQSNGNRQLRVQISHIVVFDT